MNEEKVKKSFLRKLLTYEVGWCEMKQVNKTIMSTTAAWCVLVMMILSLGVHIGFAQGRHELTKKELHSFRLARKYHYSGVQLFLKGKYDKAEKYFKKSLDAFPKFSYADYFLAKICYNKKDYMQSMVHIKRAKENFKYIRDLDVDSQLQYLDRLRQQKEDIEKDLDNPMLTKIPSSQRAEMEKDKLKIDSLLSTPIPRAKSMPADYNFVHGNILFKMKKFKEAHDQYVQAITLDPKHTLAYNNLITLFYMAKKYNMALEYIKRAESNKVEINSKLKEIIRQALQK
ncbi:MAG: tetratricopeptide repeat protein [Candidatus Aminicenantes bacterium]|nr:tetratricopeptide repeat protein [Candidatus Aminicenantes bacterium]NIM83785.1 tetratricopeptide repeat protein [Candidatus Aminicenantes bacterium]NIN46939.1 tetratricopeptide repeat protein [Candidatus Aminicenantes bacterium]NIN89861.1 tetratricopeptide repeat protein [Candidatus Aminicenantes bacterium]NIO86450.1 tetratricopeptide repeat protein [Candidatus Aminicenantes bacterium]